MEQVFLIFGPSGSGKSTVAVKYAGDFNCLHYEIDREGVDGIDFYNIREQWDLFLINWQPRPLFKLLIQRAKESGKNGIVLSFPSLIPDYRLLTQSRQAGMPSVILYGTAEECLAAFRKRELENGRNLPDEHWLVNNARSYLLMGLSEFATFRISVFSNGSRRDLGQIVDEISERIR